MTRKHWVGWAAVAIFAALCAVIFWPKSERAHQSSPTLTAIAHKDGVKNGRRRINGVSRCLQRFDGHYQATRASHVCRHSREPH